MQSNWAGTQVCSPASVVRPSTEAEVQKVVSEAAVEGQRIRVVGAHHSWSDIVVTDAVLMNLDRMDRIEHVDLEARQVTVQAGIRLKALVEALDQRGLALTMLGSISEQSLAGVLCTGTHGSGIGFGNLATMVVGLRLVSADGTVHHLKQGDDRLRAARVSLGALGVITAVTLQCVPAFRLAEYAWPVPWHEALAAMPDLIASAPYLKLWWLPHTDLVQVFGARPTDAPIDHPEWQQRLDGWLNDNVFSRLIRLGSSSPLLVPSINRVVRRAYFQRKRRVDRMDRILNLAMPPVHRETEYAMDVARTVEALRTTRHIIEHNRIKVNFIVEVRFVQADDAMLSPANGRDTVQLGAYMAQADGIDTYFSHFEREMLDLGGRPHWGKEFAATGVEIAPRYPEWGAFSALRDELDADGTFANRFVHRLFG